MVAARSTRMLVLAVVLLAAAVLAGMWAGGRAPVASRTPLSAAIATVPGSMLGVGFTDWNAALREQSAGEARQRDLMTRSVLYEMSPTERSPLDLRGREIHWEVHARNFRYGVTVVRLKRGSSFDEATLRKAGYRERRGVWLAKPGTAFDRSEVGAVAWRPEARLVIASTGPKNVQSTLDVIDGRAPALAGNRAARQAAEALAGSTSVLLEAAAIGCESTRVQGGADVRAQVEAAEDRFGTLKRYRFLGRGLSDRPDTGETQGFVVAMAFSSAALATSQAGLRAELSEGGFIGRMGSFDEVLRLRSARVDEATVVLTYDHPADSAVLMTGRGAFLPASC